LKNLTQSSIDDVKKIIHKLRSCQYDPYTFVQYIFPWGERGTSLEHHEIRGWQREELIKLGEFTQENAERIRDKKDPLTYKCAISSGRGIGKSSFVSWVSLWNLLCHFGSTTIVTAHTDDQLTNRTFAEIAGWASLSIVSKWFDMNQKKLQLNEFFLGQFNDAFKTNPKYWYVLGTLWDEDNPGAFAGAHNGNGELIIFDEASGIPANIWNVSEAVFTERTPFQFLICLGNPRENSGPFHDCFYGEKARFWKTRKIDARSVEGLPQNTYNEIIALYGEDSREARVEVRGEFPETGDKQFISRSVVLDACRRELSRLDDFAALVMGVDVARFGDDATVIRFRRGRDARSIPAIILKGADNMAVANKCAELINEHNPDGVFIDSGAGTGVIDRLKEMGYQVFEVIFGSKPDDPVYFDRRSELYGKCRDWISGAMIGGERQSDRDLIEDLVGPEYEYMGKEQKIKLESKEKLKKRRANYRSPDNADALVVTFDRPVARRDWATARRNVQNRSMKAHGVGCDVNFDGPDGSRRQTRGVGCDIDFT
jgi:hypothetical protein